MLRLPLLIFYLLVTSVFSYEDMERGEFCQDILSHYTPAKIRDDVMTDINLMNERNPLEYTSNTIWLLDPVYHRAAANRILAIAKIQGSRHNPIEVLKSVGHLRDIHVHATLCIASLTSLSNLSEWVGQNSSYYSSLLLVHKDALGTRDEYLSYLWSIRDLSWDISVGHRGFVVRLLQAGLEDKKFFDYVAPGVRSSYPHYIPMLEFFQRSTGLNYETLRQALRHEDYFVFEWAVKKISSQHITILYTDLADAINQLIGMPMRKTSSRELGRTHKLYLFHDYKYLPFEDEILVYEYKAHYLYPPPAWFYHSLPPNPKIKEEYQIRKSEKLY